MRTTALLGAACLVQAGLTSAIPALRHDKLHHARRQAGPVVETVTTTFYQTVVWVDNKGVPISTEINDPPPGATLVYSQSTPAAKPTSDALFIGAANQQQQRPSRSSQPSWKPTESPTFSQAPSPSVEPVKDQNNGANIAIPQVGSNAPGGMGVCYDPIGQSACKSRDTINQEFSFLKGQGYSMVRVYDIGCPTGDFTAAAAQNGLKLMIGINSIANLNGDINKLISMVNGDWGAVDTVYVGNELVNSGAFSAGQVADAVTTARNLLKGVGYSGNVVTVDTFGVMISDSTVCSTSDYCAANTHAFFDPNTVAVNAGQFVLNAYNKIGSTNGGKKVVITESGWPWQGNCNSKACPSPENQKAAMNSIMDSFKGMPSNMFVFQAYDATYKQPGQFGVEQFFGIYDGDHYNGGVGT